ncbi:hypothetical protein JW887_03215 [Candidatus Dojkabacteria bacterium]|nr:hypothetical protein [Candidatus Dojkabacteria bacterium]
MIEERKLRIKVLSHVTTLDTATIIFLTTILQFGKPATGQTSLLLVISFVSLGLSMLACIYSMYILAFSENQKVDKISALGLIFFSLGVYTGVLASMGTMAESGIFVK